MPLPATGRPIATGTVLAGGPRAGAAAIGAPGRTADNVSQIGDARLNMAAFWHQRSDNVQGWRAKPTLGTGVIKSSDLEARHEEDTDRARGGGGDYDRGRGRAHTG